MGLNLPSTNVRLASGGDASASPFVIAMELAGIDLLPHIVSKLVSDQAGHLPTDSRIEIAIIP